MTTDSIKNESFLSVSSNFLSTLQSYKVTVLLIDDQLIIAEAVKRMLSNQDDISFHYCLDPTKALEVASQVNPTVILQDLVMPDCDGLLLVKLFRSNPATRDIPIIVLSTKEEPSVKAEAFSLGANDYVVKLPDKLELIARIQHHSQGYIRLLERNEAYRKLEVSQQILNAELAEAAAYVRSLLPAPLKGVIQTDWRFIPSTQLGGDAFGYHWLDDDHFAIYLLDVCGHGVGAALLSISVINSLRSENLPNVDFHQPSNVLQVLNTAFQMENHNDMFFTIWYGVYNKKTRKLIYSSGGHPPAVLATGATKEEAKIYELKTPGVVIGALPVTEYKDDSCIIEAYNRLYIFSDGVYEITRPDRSMLGFAEFVKLLEHTVPVENQELDYIVSYGQEVQNKKLFADDFSILEVSFNES